MNMQSQPHTALNPTVNRVAAMNFEIVSKNLWDSKQPQKLFITKSRRTYMRANI